MINKLNGISIIPTGLGCALGGDAGFNSGVKLIASCCNKLLINPNHTNASDIAEIPENCLYVEGSSLNRFLAGYINLKETKTHNRILCVVNSPICHANINAINAGIWGLGAEIALLELETPLTMTAHINEDGTAGGLITGNKELIRQVQNLDFDMLAIHTPIDCPQEIADNYWKNGGTNPWGKVEAKLSTLLSTALNKQCVHAPVEFLSEPIYNSMTVKQSMAPEAISTTYLYCCLKGLHKAPKIDLNKDCKNLSNTDIDYLISHIDCWGPPHHCLLYTTQIPLD